VKRKTKAKAKAKTKAKRASPARKTRKPATKAKKNVAGLRAKPKPRPVKAAAPAKPAAELIDGRILDLAGWRGETLARMRALIREADPEITEEWKWDVPVWSHYGIVCTGEAYKQVVKLTFARGASVLDPTRLFNSSLEGNTRRAIDIREGERVDAEAFKALVLAAVAENAIYAAR
jgi:hypothetical protein